MQQDLARILIDQQEIATRIDAVAKEIVADLSTHVATNGHEPADQTDVLPSITLVPILTGSLIFVADLIRHLPFYMRIEMISASSYAGARTTPGTLTVQANPALEQLHGRHVLLVDDILDSGQTLKTIGDQLRQAKPASLHTCVLLRKKRAAPPEVPPMVEADYVCFDIPDEFVVGYGLDYNGYYRNLPDIAILTPQAITRHAKQD